jgi:hypothetical protein
MAVAGASCYCTSISGDEMAEPYAVQPMRPGSSLLEADQIQPGKTCVEPTNIKYFVSIIWMCNLISQRPLDYYSTPKEAYLR